MNAPPHRSLWVLPWVAAAVPFGFILLRGFPAGDDWQLELTRIAAYAQAWADGQWPPFWAPHLYGDYGSPIFLFYGQVFVALASAAALVLGSYAAGFVLALAVASACAVAGLQLTAAALTPEPDRAAGRIAVYMFVLHPYSLADVLLRNAAAEYTGLCLLPLALYGCTTRDPRRGVLWLSSGLALVLATHSLVALAAPLLLVPLAIQTRQAPRRFALAVGLALGLSACAWLPVVCFTALIRSGDLLTGKFDYHRQFQALGELFALTSRYAAGPLPLMAAGMAGFAAVRARTPVAAPLLIAFGVLALIQTSLALPLWELLPALAYFQFPWRFTGPLALASALLASLAFSGLTRGLAERKRRQLELLIFIACLLAALPQLARVHSVDRAELARFERMLAPAAMRRLLFTSTVGDEYLPAQARRDAIAHPAGEALVVAASDGLRIAVRKVEPRALVFDVKAPGAADMCLARWAFPFWEIRVDDRPQAVTHCTGGQLRVQLPAGKHHVEVSLPMPGARRVGLILSGLALLGLIGWARVTRKRSALGSARSLPVPASPPP